MNNSIDRRRKTKLTPKQLRFVYEYCTRTLLGVQSASESARRAGYAESVARKTAYELQDPNKNPLVAEAINAEALRGKAGGLYDPTIRMESAIENLPREQLLKKLNELQRKGIPIVNEENVIEHEEPKDKIKDIKLIEQEEEK